MTVNPGEKKILRDGKEERKYFHEKVFPRPGC
jgi:hypothetical protein